MAAVIKEGEDLWRYIDKNGKTIIPPMFEKAERFSEGLAFVQKGEDKGYIDRTGKLVIINRNIEYSSPFKEGKAIVAEVGFRGAIKTKFGIIDRKGNLIVEMKYPHMHKLRDGLIAVQDVNGKWGFMTPEEFWYIKPVYDEAFSFSEVLLWSEKRVNSVT